MDIIRKTIENDEEYLRQISISIELEDKSYKEEIKLLEDFCLNTECYALAAVQIGIPKRMIYLKNTTLDMDKYKDLSYNESKVLINPEIISREGQTKFWEACLSCLDYTGLVSRPYKMTLHYYDKDGKEHEDTFEGFEATVLSHEIDHLDGILHMDIAEQVLEMNAEERMAFRKEHPYEIISKTGKYNLPKKRVKKYEIKNK